MGIINDSYTVKQLAKLAGVSVRTLHYYDQIGLLVPSIRTDANYRLYGEAELLRLQQILFYKELDMNLQQISGILNEPGFDVLQSLMQHRSAIVEKAAQLSVLLSTIDKTIQQLKGENIMLTNEELYAGLSKEQANEYRNEAIEQYGEGAVLKSENNLKKMSREQIAELNKVREDINEKLLLLMNLPPDSKEVQQQIKRHYELTRAFWGTTNDPDPQVEAYSGLADLYVADERYIRVNGASNKELAIFIAEAMERFIITIAG